MCGEDEKEMMMNGEKKNRVERPAPSTLSPVRPVSLFNDVERVCVDMPGLREPRRFSFPLYSPPPPSDLRGALLNFLSLTIRVARSHIYIYIK